MPINIAESPAHYSSIHHFLKYILLLFHHSLPGMRRLEKCDNVNADRSCARPSARPRGPPPFPTARTVLARREPSLFAKTLMNGNYYCRTERRKRWFNSDYTGFRRIRRKRRGSLSLDLPTRCLHICFLAF